MSKLVTTVLLLMSFVFSNAQSQCSIKGEITTPQRNYVLLHYPDSYWLQYYVDTIKLSSDNTFDYVFRFPSATTRAMLEVDDQNSFDIWCAHDGKLSVKIGGSTRQPGFSGSLGRVQQYLQTEETFKAKVFATYQQRNPGFQNPKLAGSDAYYIIHDSITIDRMDSLYDYFTNSPNPYEKLFLSDQKIKFVYLDLYYKIMTSQLNKFKSFQTGYNVNSPVTYRFSDEINFNNPSLLYHESFLNFARSYFRHIAVESFEGKIVTREKYFKDVFSAINKASNNAICNSILKASFINDEINMMKGDVFEEGTTEIPYRQYVDSLKGDTRIQKQALLVENNLNESLQELSSLRNGTASPECLLIDSSGNTKTWNDFKGKTVYIDVWASWCAPCISSFPEWNALPEKFKTTNDIVYITVSIDDSKDSWLKALNKHRPGGVHLLAVGGFKSDFAKKFKINGIPANILIDQEGRIINIRAERPETIDLSEFAK